ncbi:MAG: COX15/CtaA family protein [Flammeovirgaceae bacterium]|nr:MAG: COX15/CtaA family protein [Flammeovirgaceae bacterium]
MHAFRKLVFSTLVAVYFLILVGGIVRSTGSGMGCPDWPKCFGSWVPPASVSELPPDYKQIYSDYRDQKNRRFAKYLSALGFTDTAEAILADESIKEEADFNPVKTWIEYVNRLVGVTIGLLIIAVVLASLKFRKEKKIIPAIAVITLVLVVFQGWIGSVVVSTNLTPWTITLHMLLALLIVCLLIYLGSFTQDSKPVGYPSGLSGWLFAAMGLLLVQIILGTQVREALDRVATAVADRSLWVSQLGFDFIIHRSFSWIVLIVSAVFVFKSRKYESLKGFTATVFLLILGTFLSGAGMAWFSVPAFLQPVHLLLATVSFGVQFQLLLCLNKPRRVMLNYSV